MPDPVFALPHVYEVESEVPPGVWASVRDAICAGVPEDIVIRRAGVRQMWLRARANREKWMTPQRRMAILAEYRLDDPERVARVKQDLDIAAAALSADEGIKHRAEIVSLARSKIKESVPDLPAPRNWKELDIADKMARRAFGMEDGPQHTSMIQISLLDGSMEVEDAPRETPMVWEPEAADSE